MPPLKPIKQPPKLAVKKTAKPLIVRLINVFTKALLVLACLLALPLLMKELAPTSRSLVKAKWQQLTLLQQPLPQDNSLPNPLTDRHLTDTWGGARSEGRSHEGIDIFAPRGTPIQATTAGVVRKVGDDRLGGRVVVIIGPGGAGHYYAHLESYADISPNDWVDAGDIIGYVGDSGNAKGTPPHVHYGIYINGSAVNPYPLLQKP